MIFNMVAKKQEGQITSGFRMVANGMTSQMAATTFQDYFGGSVTEFIDYDGIASTIDAANIGDALVKLVTCAGQINLNYMRRPNLEDVTILSASRYISSCFAQNPKLKVVRLYPSTSLAASMFYSCSQLMSIYLYYSAALVQCGRWWFGTPFSTGASCYNSNARVYVPANLLSTYQNSRTAGAWYSLYSANSAVFAAI